MADAPDQVDAWADQWMVHAAWEEMQRYPIVQNATGEDRHAWHEAAKQAALDVMRND